MSSGSIKNVALQTISFTNILYSMYIVISRILHVSVYMFVCVFVCNNSVC